LPSLCEHLHLPLQSGDNEVLKRMKRSYSVESYRQIVADLRHAKPGIAMSTDIIVGFPGETEEQFQHTLDLYEDVRFDQAYMFIYSPRRHTEAFDYGDMSVPHDVAQGRLERLIATANRIAHENNERDVGKTFEVLVEGLDQKGRRLTGRTRTNKTVIFAGDRSLIGQLVPVLTEKAYLWGFEGSIS